jgi:hypothetical protein
MIYMILNVTYIHEYEFALKIMKYDNLWICKLAHLHIFMYYSCWPHTTDHFDTKITFLCIKLKEVQSI